MQCVTTIDSGEGKTRFRKLFFLFLVLPVGLFPDSVSHCMEGGERGRFFVTGHVRPILKEKEGVGVVEGFLEKGVPFIKSAHPEFVVFTGDVVLGGIDGFHRFPIESLKKQYDFFVKEVIGRIEAKVYCVAGNHDTGSIPHAPSIALFEKLLNPLRFSFEHKGSLFLFLSLYEPFHHMPQNNNIAPFAAIWEEYDTEASRAFLDTLRQKLSGGYDHIFVFAHASPCSDTPIGYYWTHFLIPLFSSTGKDVHVFSTEHFARRSLYYQVHRVVKCDHVRFYNFAVFPRGGYMVHFDSEHVKVDFFTGDNLVPTPLQEADCQAATRLSMLLRYLTIEIGYPIRGKYNRVVGRLKNYFQ